MKQEKHGYIILSLALIFEVITFVLSEYVLQFTNPLTFAIHFFLLTAVLITPIYFWHYGIQTISKTWKTRWKDISIVSWWFVLVALLFFFVIDAVGATSIALFEKFAIVFSALIGILLLNEKVSKLELVGMATCFIGAVSLAIEDFTIQKSAVIMGLSFALVISIISYTLKKYVSDIGTTLFNFYRVWIMTIVITLITFIVAEINILSPKLMFFSLLAGLSGIMGGAQFYMLAHKYLPISTIHSLSAITPILVAISSFFIFGSVPGQWKIFGGLLIILGSILIIIFRKKESQAPATVETEHMV